MRLTLHTDYGVRALLYLAAAPDHRGTVGQIAEAYGISRHHLSKVATRLADAGLIASSAGRSGGLALAVDPGEVSLGGVVRLLEEDFAYVECLGSGGHCAIDGCCLAKGAFLRAGQAFLTELDRVTLAEATANRDGVSLALQITRRP
jgi:Rrf2 family nitric oxide-sensitive transcriptional repressor